MIVTSAHSSTVTSSTRVPVILGPPLLVPSDSHHHQSAPRLLHGSEETVDASSRWSSDQVETSETGSAGDQVVSRLLSVESHQLADEAESEEDQQEWSWRYDEHGKRIWYRRSVVTIAEGHAAGSVRFARRPSLQSATSTSKPPASDGYWLVDDRGSYLWYRFVESGGGQYVRDPDVETVHQDHMSPDEQRSSAHDRLTWTGVGRSVCLSVCLSVTAHR